MKLKSCSKWVGYSAGCPLRARQKLCQGFCLTLENSVFAPRSVVTSRSWCHGDGGVAQVKNMDCVWCRTTIYSLFHATAARHIVSYCFMMRSENIFRIMYVVTTFASWLCQYLPPLDIQPTEVVVSLLQNPFEALRTTSPLVYQRTSEAQAAVELSKHTYYAKKKKLIINSLRNVLKSPKCPMPPSGRPNARSSQWPWRPNTYADSAGSTHPQAASRISPKQK